ncbi:hypothetical protein DsansV1_C13g0124571 [Dioscorea sansibarensis]
MKLVRVFDPRRRKAASSYAFAASSAVSNVPNHILIFLVVSLISATHRPDGLCLTPTNFCKSFESGVDPFGEEWKGSGDGGRGI